VPRCASCEAVHRQSAPVFKVAVPIGILISMSLCVLIGVLASQSLKFWAWVIGTVVSLVAVVAVVALGASYENRQATKACTRGQDVANTEFPEAKELGGQEWQVDSSQTGTSTSQKASASQGPG